MLNNSGNRPYPQSDLAFWDEKSLQGRANGYRASEECAAGVAPSKLQGYGYDEMDVKPPQEYAAHVNAQKAIADVMWAQGPSYPDKDYYEKLVGAGYALGVRDANDQEVYQVKKSVTKSLETFGKPAKSFYEILEDFTRQLQENGYEAPVKLTFTSDGLKRINYEFGIVPEQGYQRTKAMTVNATIELDSSAPKKSCCPD